jgi:HD-GYP domain-containing protein (c-di-GMP phosphodiesterase class II)
MAIALISRGKSSGRRIPINHWPATIGRDNNSVVPVDDDRVSRYHARIKKRDKLYILEDLQSKNGTYLNGDKISNSTINSGDKILVGDTEIIFLTPETQIDISTEFSDLEHFTTGVDLEDAGGPILISNEAQDAKTSEGYRINIESDMFIENISQDILTKIFELHSNILTSDHLNDLCANVLKGLHSLQNEVSRSVFFLWSSGTRRLLPLATRQTNKATKFIFSKRTFEGVIARRQGFILNTESIKGTNTKRQRIILPVIHRGQLLGLIHLEVDNIALPIIPEFIFSLRLLVERAAPSIDAFILRQELESYSVGMIESMIATLEAKDTYTHGHSERVSRYSLAIADEMNLDREVKRLLLMSSLCHDIGKIGIPDSILRKAALLNPDEYEEMKQHPVIGSNIVSHLPNAKRFISGIKYHHEKWDGSGYPDGLTGEEIPFFGRIVAVADVFDAMISGRSYSGFMDESEAVGKLGEDKELFDPDVVRAFIKAWQSGRLTQKTSTLKNHFKMPVKG